MLPHTTARIRRLLGAATLVTLATLPLQADATEAPAPDPFDTALTLYVQGDLTGAAQAFGVLAKQGHPGALHNLAAMHLRSELPNSSVETARELLMMAAQRGFVTSQYALGELFESGRLGKQELTQALAWYRLSAESGSVDGAVATGTAYLMGRGTPADSAQAAQWYRQAANGGEMGAMYILASLYEKGDGVAPDLRLARYWYAAAASAGDEAAPYKVKELDARAAAEAASAPESP